jgi:hypothetical protein
MIVSEYLTALNTADDDMMQNTRLRPGELIYAWSSCVRLTCWRQAFYLFMVLKPLMVFNILSVFAGASLCWIGSALRTSTVFGKTFTSRAVYQVAGLNPLYNCN